jgi:hypothetical protein
MDSSTLVDICNLFEAVLQGNSSYSITFDVGKTSNQTNK